MHRLRNNQIQIKQGILSIPIGKGREIRFMSNRVIKILPLREKQTTLENEKKS